MLRKLIVGAVAAGAVLAGATATASAAPATGTVGICVDGGADYSAVLQWPSRGGFETTITNPNTCWPGSMTEGAGETIVVLGIYRGTTFNLGHFTSNGSRQIVHAHGAVGAGTENFTISN